MVQLEVIQQHAVEGLDSDVGSMLDVGQERETVTLVAMHQRTHQMRCYPPIVVVV